MGSMVLSMYNAIWVMLTSKLCQVGGTMAAWVAHLSFQQMKTSAEYGSLRLSSAMHGQGFTGNSGRVVGTLLLKLRPHWTRPLQTTRTGRQLRGITKAET